jgi:hypothetical protein
MFLVSDTITDRHNRIEQFNGADIFIGVLLATMDFEWTMRRAIIALGYQKNTTIREEVLKHCHGAGRYKKAWADQVFPLHEKRLPEIISNWGFFEKEEFPLRHRLVHGIKGATGVEYAQERRDSIMMASKALYDFAKERDVDLYKKLRVRRKDLRLPQ